jgi:hypothetical protein
MDKNYEQIELRSEKVRNIIGRIPPLLIRSGITLIALLITGLAVAACFIPFPENVKGKVEVAINSHSEIEITAFIPYTEIAGGRNQQRQTGNNQRREIVKCFG